MPLVGFRFVPGFFGANPARLTHWEVNQDGVQPTAAGKRLAPPDRGSRCSGRQGEWFPPRTNTGKQADSPRERIPITCHNRSVGSASDPTGISLSLKGASMFLRTDRQSAFWPAAALLALLAAPHMLLAQDAPSTVQANVENRTEKDIEFTLVGPDGKALGPARTVKAGYVYRTNPRTLPKGSAKGYKWVLRDPDTKKVLKNSPADNGRITIVEGVFGRGELPRESRLAFVTNRTAKPVEFALVGPDGKDLGPARSVQPGKQPYRTSNRTLPKGSA